jgi:hypothetical protein
MNRIEYTINRICRRRGFTATKIESVALATRLDFGLANGTGLLAAAGSTFYYLDTMNVLVIEVQTGAGAQLGFTNLGGGSAGTLLLTVPMPLGSQIAFRGLETDSLTYFVNGNTAGKMFLSGTAYKVTYA